MIEVKPYFGIGRSQFRIGISYRRPLDNAWRRRYLWVGLSWQLPKRQR